MEKIFPNVKTRRVYDEDELAFDIGLQVQEARIKKGITQRQLAILVGTKQPSIARLENGSGLPSFRFLFKVAQSLGLSIEVLFKELE